MMHPLKNYVPCAAKGAQGSLSCTDVDKTLKKKPRTNTDAGAIKSPLFIMRVNQRRKGPNGVEVRMKENKAVVKNKLDKHRTNKRQIVKVW